LAKSNPNIINNLSIFFETQSILAKQPKILFGMQPLLAKGFEHFESIYPF